ncbi:MAG TPA: hypothetical protein VFB02_27630 [Bradyrhizobium sp.]|nr:hypothetical protein [Bradyrhizobium sp.]
MVLKGVFYAVLGAALIAGGAASAADYKPDEFLSLDLSKAVLSPTPLGPESTFAPVAVEAKGDTVSGVLARNDARKVAVERVKAAPVRAELSSTARHEARLAEASGEKRHGAARTRLAHRHGNPMNAEAMDSRIQKWPCNPDMGGICAWRR